MDRLPHFWKEMYKFLITARGWIVICVVVFITIFICNNQKIAYSEDEKKRDEYYQQYGGRDYSGFTSLIEQRQMMFMRHRQSWILRENSMSGENLVRMM